MDIIGQIRTVTAKALLDHFQYTISPGNILVNETKPEFKGDYTVVLFSFIRELKSSPEALGIRLRAQRLTRDADAATRAGVERALARLREPAERGTLFQALALTGPNGPAPAGFPAPAR